MSDPTTGATHVKKSDLPITQEVIDKLTRQKKEAEEKNVSLEQENMNLVQENVGLKTNLDEQFAQPAPVTTVPAATVPIAERKDLSNEEWNTWHQSDPGAATEWKTKQTYKKEKAFDAQKASDQSFLDAQKVSREKIVTKHPDMYLKNADGSVKRTQEGVPLLDMANPKTAIFNEIITKDPDLVKLKTGPEKAMDDMEKLHAARTKTPEEIAEAAKAEGVREQQIAAAGAQGAHTAGSTSAPVKPAAGSEDFEKILTPGQRRTADKLKVSYKDYYEETKHERKAPVAKVEYK